MVERVESVEFQSGAPAWLTSSYRYKGYRIRGRGFGTRRGVVTIDGELQRVVRWSPDQITIAMPKSNPFGNPGRAPAGEVARAAPRPVAAKTRKKAA